MIIRKGLETTTTTIATAAIMASLAMLMMTTITTTAVHAQTTPENMTATTTTTTTAATTNATTTAPINLEFEDEPFAVGRTTPVSETVINETQQQTKIVYEGNTTITLPNTTESITIRDTGEGIVTPLPGGGIIRGQLHMTTEDGSESAEADFVVYFLTESPMSIGLLYFSTNSTSGMLAPLNQMIAVSLYEDQPNGDVVRRWFEWKPNAGDGGGLLLP